MEDFDLAGDWDTDYDTLPRGEFDEFGNFNGNIGNREYGFDDDYDDEFFEDDLP